MEGIFALSSIAETATQNSNECETLRKHDTIKGSQ